VQRSSIDPVRVVRLRSATDAPYDDAIAAARTCYSTAWSRRGDHRAPARQHRPLTYGGGHHTVFQHATFEFELSGVSRQLVWSVLHGFPFYNTEQQSQRYVKLGTPAAHVPPELGGRARESTPRRSSAAGRLSRAHRASSRRSRARS
jgi:thymidylate synthase ThyX